MNHIRLLSICSLFALASCGLTSNQKSALTEFGAATSTFATTVGSVAPGIQDGVDEMRQSSLVQPSSESSQDFQHHLQEGPDGIYNYAHNPDARAHIALIETLAASLKTYGSSLVDLANYGDASARSDTIVDLATKFDGAFSQPVAASDAKAGGLVLGFITNEIIEAVKKNDIKAVVSAYEPAVNQAAALLKAEFAGETEGTLVFSCNAETRAFDNRISAGPAPGTGPGADVLQSRQRFIDAQLLLHEEENACSQLSRTGSAAAGQLQKANDAVVAALQSDTLSLDDVKTFATQVQALYQAINAGK